MSNPIDHPLLVAPIAAIYIEVVQTMTWPDGIKLTLQIAIGCATLYYLILKIRLLTKQNETLLKNEQRDERGRIVGK